MVVLSRELKGFVLVLIIAFSAYLTIVQIVNTYAPSDILKSFSVKSLRRPSSSATYLMGDSLVVEADSDWASQYDLRVCANSSQVFESILAGGSHLRTQVPLVPDEFAPGKPYTLSLEALVLNNPIPGASYTDSASYTFGVASTQTTLGLSSTYDTSINWLYSLANLTDADGYPVANETVSFYLQLKGSDPLTDGWIPLGSGLTDDNGTALMTLGFPVFCQMAVKACHEGNENFGQSQATADVQVTSNFTEGLLYMQHRAQNTERTGKIGALDAGALDVGTVNITMSTNSPYAHLPVKVNVTYTSDSQLNGSMGNYALFYLDNLTTCFSASGNLNLVSNGSQCVYDVMWPWPQGPNATGIHTLIAGILQLNDTRKDIWLASLNGTGLIATGNITLNMIACPSNLVLHLPEASYASAMPVSVGFARPWPYDATDDGEFTASSLAPQISYDGINYTVDQPVNVSVPVSVCVNGTSCGKIWTDANGSARFQLNSTAANSTLTINCTADGSALLLNSSSVVRSVTLTSISITDSTSSDGNMSLGCTVDGQGSVSGVGNETIYVQDENPVGLSVSWNGSAVSTAPASVLIGKPLSRGCTNSSGWASVPANSSMLRVDCLCSPSQAGWALSDVNRDGFVDGKDIGVIAAAFGSYPGQSNWNFRADLNLDGVVDGKDIKLCAGNFGGGPIDYYYNVTDCSVVNASFVGNTVNVTALDSSGCVAVPSGASWVDLTIGGSPVGAVVEFFNSTFHQACVTDDSGQSAALWTPNATGSVNAISPGGGPWPYMALAWVPLDFVVLTQHWSSSTTSKSDPLIVATYLNVVTRPVSLTVTNSSYVVQDLCLFSTDDTYAWQRNRIGNYSGDTDLMVGWDVDTYWQQYYRLYSFAKFDISSIPANAQILSAQLMLMCIDDSLDMTRTYGVYSISTSNWTASSLTWSNCPIDFSLPAGTLSKGPEKLSPLNPEWWTWDVTSAVQAWLNGSIPNFGFIIADNSNSPPNAPENCSFSSSRFIGGGYGPTLNVLYTQNQSIVFSAQVLDGVNGSAIPYQNVSWSVNGYQPVTPTNSSGVAVMTWTGPFSTAAYNLSASYAGTNIYQSSSVNLCVDLRIPTFMAVNDGGTWTRDFVTFNVTAYEQQTFQIWATPPGVSEAVGVYVNGTYFGSVALDYNWEAQIPFTANTTGVYYINLTYVGDPAFQPSQLCFACIAGAVPACLGFNVTSEFAPGDNVTLSAQVTDPFTNQSLNGVKVGFWLNGTSCVANATTDQNGVATTWWIYPTNSTDTVVPELAPNQGLANCTLMVEPVMLTVGNETRLLLDASRDQQGTGHTISARLVDAGGSGLRGCTVTLNVNGTSYQLQTSSSGYATLYLNLPPGDTSANTYQVQATFNGTNPRSTSLNASDPYGDQYAVCTTNQYDLLPSTNSSTLSVLLQYTDSITAAKTMEQMQQEAEQSGTLRVRNEFSIFYPWYRYHMVYFLGGIQQFDIGVGVLGGNIVTATNDFTNRIEGYVHDISWDLFTDWVAGEAVQVFGAWSGQLWIWAIAVASATAIKAFLLYAESWDSLQKLHTAYVAQFVSLMVEVGSFIAQFTLGNMIRLMGSIGSFNGAVWAVLTLIANIILDIVFFINLIDTRICQLGGP